jgi:hypothetical protein
MPSDPDRRPQQLLRVNREQTSSIAFAATSDHADISSGGYRQFDSKSMSILYRP